MFDDTRGLSHGALGAEANGGCTALSAERPQGLAVHSPLRRTSPADRSLGKSAEGRSRAELGLIHGYQDNCEKRL